MIDCGCNTGYVCLNHRFAGRIGKGNSADSDLMAENDVIETIETKVILVFMAKDKEGYEDAIFAADNLVTLIKMINKWKIDADMGYWNDFRIKIINYREESGI